MQLFARRRRHLARWLEVTGTIARFGGYHIVDYLGLRELVPRRLRHAEHPPDLPARLRAAIEELGPTYIKLAQVLSTRPDLVPPRYIEELAKLQDTAPPIPFSKIRAVVESELGCTLEDAFRYFSETPLAAASLAQAHAAVLHDGTAVVVKVQRPGIAAVMETDFEIIADVAQRVTQRWEQARVLSLPDLVEEFQSTTREELNYTREGRNMDRLRENLKAVKGVHVPEVYWNLSTARVLTQERIHGAKITAVERLRVLGIDPHAVAQTLANAFMQQIFIDGFFHADPHPGNLVVTDEGTLVLLDFGMVSRLDESIRESVIRLLIGFVEENSRYFADQILELGRPLHPLNRKRFTADADRMLRRYYDLPASEVNIGQVLNDTLRLCTAHQIELPSNFGLLVKVMASLDGTTKRLDPDYSYLEAARRFLRRAITERLQWSSFSLDAFEAAMDTKRLLLDLPQRSNQVLTKLAEGEFRIQLEHRGMEKLTRHLDRIGNRISYSLVIAALLLGSALFSLARIPPYIHGYPVIGAATFITAVVMGIWLLVAILRSGNLR